MCDGGSALETSGGVGVGCLGGELLVECSAYAQRLLDALDALHGHCLNACLPLQHLHLNIDVMGVNMMLHKTIRICWVQFQVV